MEGTLRSTVSGSGKQRRRTVAKTGRKFLVKDMQKKTVLPTPATVSSKKWRKVVLFRVFALGTLFFILLSTFALWRKRDRRMVALIENPDSLNKLRSSLSNRSEDHVDKTKALKGAKLKDAEMKNDLPEGHNHLNLSKDGKPRYETEESVHGEEADMPTFKTNLGHHPEPMVSSKETETEHSTVLESQKTDVNANHQSDDGTTNRIEWYTRDDYKEGRRPICLISKPIVLSNGTILVPDWMQGNEKLLHRCGLGQHSFYSSSAPAGVKSIVDIDADFALTIHLEKFQEPTHVPSVYLTEHVLKASYLFDTFSGVTGPKEGVRENHCVATEKDTKCGLPRSENILKPSIFVPRRIERGPEASWPRLFVNMFGVAHGSGNGVVHLNASSILIKSHAKQSDDLVGTRFRSIMATDGMFRHLPPGAWETSSFFSEKNGIPRKNHHDRRTKEGKCAVTIGIAVSSKQTLSGFEASNELKEKLEMLSKFAALPKIDVKEIEASSATDIEEHIMQMQDLDVFVAGSGDDLTSICFLAPGSMVFELMPFGITPVTYRSLAQALNVDYKAIKGKPDDDSFKQCIELEIFNLRKRGKLEFSHPPAWQKPLMKAWENAVGEFVMSGATKFDILTSEEPVKNYFSKQCALKQKVEIGVDEAARQVITGAKLTCAST